MSTDDLSAQEALTFANLGLSSKVLSAVSDAGYTIPTPIQAGAIPHALQGKDVLGIAQTGTGKTAVAFQMGRSIVVPLRRLIRAADRIAAGDLEVRLSATRRDELGHLTQVFNQMTDRLRRNHAEIMAAN